MIFDSIQSLHKISPGRVTAPLSSSSIASFQWGQAVNTNAATERKPWDRLARFWQHCLDVGLVLWILRVPVCAVLFGLLLLGYTSQAQDLFVQYGDTAREVLSLLLEQYIERGILQFNTLSDLMKVKPFDRYGSPSEIAINHFGGVKGMKDAVSRLQTALYQ